MSTERDAKGGDVKRKRFQQKEMSGEGDFETKSLSMERDVERKGCQENEVQRERERGAKRQRWDARRKRWHVTGMCQQNEGPREIDVEKEMSRDRNAKREGCQYKKIQEKQNETNAKTQRCQIAQLARKHGPEDSGWPLQWHTALQYFLPTLAVFWGSCIYSIISSACQVNIQFRIRSWGKPISSLPSSMCNSANEHFFGPPTFECHFDPFRVANKRGKRSHCMAVPSRTAYA